MIVMFHLDGHVWFDAGKCRQDVIEDLLCGHSECTVARAHFYPAGFIAVIALGEVLGANQDNITIIGQVHRFLTQ